VKTASGATAVQIVHKRGRTVLGIDHIGSAHDEDQLALLLERAKQRLNTDQQILEFDLSPPRPADPGTPVVDATGSLILWQALCGVYDALGFGAVGDEAFQALVLARIIEPTSKLDTVRGACPDLRGFSVAIRCGFSAAAPTVWCLGRGWGERVGVAR
jgi:hypothetical protein